MQPLSHFAAWASLLLFVPVTAGRVTAAPSADQNVMRCSSLVLRVAFSPDGKMIASAQSDGFVTLWSVDGRKKQVLAVAPGTNYGVAAAAFSPDGRYLALGIGHPEKKGAAGTVELWSIETWKQVAKNSTFHKGGTLDFAFRPDGKELASVGHTSGVIIHDVPSLNKRRTLKPSVASDTLFSVAWSPDGKYVAAVGLGKPLQLWDSDGTNHRTQKIPEERRFATSVTFSPDGKFVAAASNHDDDARPTATLYDVERNLYPTKSFVGQKGKIHCIAFAPDGKSLATGSEDGTIKLWDVTTGEEKETLSGHDGPVYSIAFSPSGKVLASGSSDRTVRIWALPIADSENKPIQAPKSLEAAMAHLEKVFGRFTQDDNRQFRFVFDNDEATIERGEDETILIVKNGIKTYGVPIRSGKQIEIDVIETIQRKIYDVGPQGERTLSRRIENHMTRRYLLHRELTGGTFAVISVSHSIPHFRNRPMRTGRVNWIENGLQLVGFGTDYFFRKGGGLQLGANLARYTLLRDGNRLVQTVQSQSYELATSPDGQALPMPDFDRPFGDAFKKKDVSEAIVEE